MKKNMKKENLLFSLIMALAPMMANAQDLRHEGLNGIYYRCYEGSTYQGIENDAYIVEVDKNLTGTVIIPKTVTQNGIVYTVTVIDEGAFEECQLSAIVLPDDIRLIDEDAFSDCKNMTAVYIGKNIEHIGETAFSGCVALRDFTILAGPPPTVNRHDPIVAELRSQITLHAPTEVLGYYWSDDPFWGTFAAYDDVISIPTANNGKTGIAINKENFPDDAFRAYVGGSDIDTDQDGQLSDAEIAAVEYINVPYKGIKSMQGIEFFTALKYLQADNNEYTTLDLSKNTALIWAMCWANALVSIDVSECKELTQLSVLTNELETLDVSKNTKLEKLYCWGNRLTTLDLSKLTKLEVLTCNDNLLTELDVSQNTELDTLACQRNAITTLDVSKNTKLVGLYCWGNLLTELDVTHCPELNQLDCGSETLTSVDVSKCPKLTYLGTEGSSLKKLDISNNPALESLFCMGNQLTELDVKNHAQLEILWCCVNQLTELEVCSNGALISLDIYGNQIAGQAMDRLIASMPNVENGEFFVVDSDDPEGEHNVCTAEQVAAANDKGWQCYHWYNEDWQLYAGSDPSAIAAPQSPSPADGPAYDLGGRRVGPAPRKGILIRDGRKYIYK